MGGRIVVTPSYDISFKFLTAGVALVAWRGVVHQMQDDKGQCLSDYFRKDPI